MKAIFSQIRDALKANLIPGLILQFIALVLILTYYYVAPVQAFWELVAAYRIDLGITFAFLASAIFGGIIPFLIKHYFRQAYKLPIFIFSFTVVFWGYKGFEVDLFYTIQAGLFGNNAGVLTILQKALVDQFLYVPFLGLPPVILSYKLLDNNFDFKAVFTKGWYAQHVTPALITNWIIWFPASLIVYTFPLSLQLPIFNLILCFWVLMIMFLAKPVEAN